MEDAYTIGIRLLLEDSVSAGLASIQAELASVDHAIAATTGRLAGLRVAVARPSSPEAPDPAPPATADNASPVEIVTSEPLRPPAAPAVSSITPSVADVVAVAPSAVSAAPSVAPAAPDVAPAAPRVAVLAALVSPPPRMAVDGVTPQVPLAPISPAVALPLAQPARPPVLQAAPIYSALSLPPAIREADAKPRQPTHEPRDPAIFAPRLAAPVLPALLPMLSARTSNEPERVVRVPAAVSTPTKTTHFSGAQETVSKPAGATASAIVAVATAPAAPAAPSPAQPIAPFMVLPPHIAAAPAAPVDTPAVAPIASDVSKFAFAPTVLPLPIVAAPAAVSQAANAASQPAPSRQPTSPPAQARPAAADHQQDTTEDIASGDVYLDGTRLGRWMRDHLTREVSRPQAGTAAFDPTLSPSWPGALQGS